MLGLHLRSALVCFWQAVLVCQQMMSANWIILVKQLAG